VMKEEKDEWAETEEKKRDQDEEESKMRWR
jgi:hypothetical protein